MRISKRQLRKIIREEKKKLLNESFSPMRSRVDPYLARQFSSKMDLSEAPYGPAGAEEYNVGYQRDKKRETMSAKVAEAIQLLQTAHVNLEELALGITGIAETADAASEIFINLELIKDAIHMLGGNLP